jgi:CYTH domain-containing protein
MIESELSFLIKELPELSRLEHKNIEQHYLSDGPEPLRTRRIGGRFELTKKLDVAPGDLSRKEELNIPLTEEEFMGVCRLSRRSLTKTRYYLPLPGGLTAEVDVFHGPLEGLAMVEVEFADEAARNAFVPPAWFGRDVTQENWSANSFLAGRSIDDIRKFI